MHGADGITSLDLLQIVLRIHYNAKKFYWESEGWSKDRSSRVLI